MKYKYIILDFGKVLSKPAIDNWLITPAFVEKVDMSKIEKEKLYEAMKKYGYLLNGKVVTTEEEYKLLIEFYKNVLENVGYKESEDCVKSIAYDFVYNDSKYELYDDVVEQLQQLSNEYTLIILSDNWPCLYEYMKKKDIEKYFEKVYVSSVYGELKRDGLFFNHPIEEFNIGKGEALFIDDNESLLDVAVTKGLDVKLMDRDKKVSNSKYEIVHNLSEIVHSKER